MHLEKLQIQGFKSFANKNKLIFDGILNSNGKRGITAIVGPNGSGKSNVSDAVRWALGEQSIKTLRGKKAEDVIFSGSDKKGKLGMAEVSLYLNNEDKKIKIDYSQIVLTRRLYRNGDSEYLLNNNKVRLSDIQMLLAKAKFGQKTYSVIGQGMVEGFLNTSLSERKEFFDEATGVKQYQIKRDDSLNKLRASHENLGQARLLLTEIEPRLKSLTRQVNKLHKRDELKNNLKNIQIKYYGNIWNDINNKFRNYNNIFLKLEKEKLEKDNKFDLLNKKLEELKKENQQDNNFFELQEKLRKLQSDKDVINNKLSRIETQIEIKLEAKGKFDLSFLLSKKEDLKKEIINTNEEINNLICEIDKNKIILNDFINKKERINTISNNLNNKIINFRQTTQKPKSKKINDRLQIILKNLSEIDTIDDKQEIKNKINKIKQELKNILNNKESDKENEQQNNKEQQEWEEIHKKLQEITSEKEKNSLKINEFQLKIATVTEKSSLLKEKKQKTNDEIQNIETKIKRNSEGVGEEELEKTQKELNDNLKMLIDEMNIIKNKINKIREFEEEKRNKLFSLQQEIQDLQIDINKNSTELNELKVSSARLETKLEDLEIEIRKELGGLKEIKEIIDLDINNLKNNIFQIKKQLETIGGIDPEIEQEYNNTKERFDFLFSQVDDFSNAVESLEKIIKELDVVIKKQFDEEFKLIAQNFEKYFKILFNGGSAKIIKITESFKEKENIENQEDVNTFDADIKKIKFLQKHNATGLAGIEIQATPPGKKIKSITMLSGGERALTTIALICAIISANPSPFVVLDEVDAALDEANSERLAKILDELSSKTQFITITHNRAVMYKANVLYGVTMGDDGVSKLLSVKLDDIIK